ncbi:MAG TPA: hypothetical protein VJ689_06655 [Gaiellaceae bacterium]|nr:hypothetical protein [Gaiellaceae bacterium]
MCAGCTAIRAAVDAERSKQGLAGTDPHEQESVALLPRLDDATMEA